MSSVSLAQLSQQFSGAEWPAFVALDRAGDAYELELRIDPEIAWFAGHFPGQPVLPGIVQTHWAGCLGQHLFTLPGSFSQLRNLKFQSMILSGARVSLKLEPLPNNDGLRFSYYQGDRVFSDGKLDFCS